MIAQAYLTLIERIDRGCYYLWGAIQNALLLEFRDGKTDLISRIFLEGKLTDDHRIPETRRNMLIQVLLESGQEDEAKLKRYLYDLLDGLQSARSRRNALETQKIVAFVAGQLGLKDILLQLLMHKNEGVRRSAVYSAASLIQMEDATVMELLKELRAKAVGRFGVFSLRRRPLQSCLEISLSILFVDFKNERTVNGLLEIWSDLLGNLLLHTGTDDGSLFSRVINPVARRVRGLFLMLAVRLVLQVAKRIEEEKLSNFDIKEMECFFRDSGAKKRFDRLIPYIDPHHKLLDDIIEDLRVIVTQRDIFSTYLMLVILVARINTYPRETAVVISGLFRSALELDPGSPAIQSLIASMSSLFDGLTGDEIDPDLLKIEEEMIVTFHNVRGSISMGQTGPRFIYSGLSSYPQYSHRKNGEVNREVLNVFVEGFTSKNNVNYEKIRNYLTNVVNPGHPQYRDMWPMLECLRPVLEIAFPEDGHEPESVTLLKNDLIDSLAKIRAYDAEKVDFFMDLEGIPSGFQQQVRNENAEKEIASAISSTGIFFGRDIVLQPGTHVWELLVWWFRQAPVSRNFGSWLGIGIKRILNEICGEALFPAEY